MISKASQLRYRGKKKLPKQKSSSQLRKLWKRKLLGEWSRLVRANASNKCEKCGRADIKLDPHHIIPRKTAVKPHWFRLDNGVCLCYNCHRDGAHSLDFDKQEAFHNWLRAYLPKRGQNYDTLKAICNAKGSLSTEEMKLLYNEFKDQTPHAGGRSPEPRQTHPRWL